jgi:hypothetical protein
MPLDARDTLTAGRKTVEGFDEVRIVSLVAMR